MKKKAKKIEKNCGSDVAGCEIIAQIASEKAPVNFNNCRVVERQECVMRVPMFVASKTEYLLAIGKLRNPRLEVCSDDEPYEVMTNVWSARCIVIWNKL